MIEQFSTDEDRSGHTFYFNWVKMFNTRFFGHQT